MVGPMMWFKREPKPVTEKSVENGAVGKLKRKKAVLLKPTRESSERETSTESDKEKRRYSDILDMKVSQERRDESDESLYESADCHSDAISASDDALPRLGKTPTMSKESLKLAVTDEEVDQVNIKTKKGHRKAMSLSNPLEIVKTLGDEWFEAAKKELDKNSDKKKSRESLWSEEDRDSIHGSSMKLDQLRKNSKKETKSQSNSRQSSTTEAPKSRKSSKGSSVSALNFLRRKKTPTSTAKAVEAVIEVVDKIISTEEILNYTKFFLEEEKRYASTHMEMKPPVETDSDDEPPTPKLVGEHRRRLSRQTSRSKSKARGKSQTVKVNTIRKSHSGTLKKGKKKNSKTPLPSRSRQASIVESTPIVQKKDYDSSKQNSWLFSGSRGEPRREGSTEEQTAPDGDVDTSDATTKEQLDKDNNWRSGAGGGRGVNRAESCRERDAPRRGKHRNASDPNRLTAHNNHDLEPGAPTAPSGSSSSSSLSSRSNESNTAATEQHASQSDWSEEEEPLAAAWADSLPPHALDSLLLSSRLRKRQEVIHELIVSEGSHVRWLKVLGGVFLRPLESQPTLLPPEDLRALFPNLPGVRERHAKLYADLRAVRNEANNHIVQIRPIADAMLNTLGEASYASCLSRFCCGQRMALDALKERRRKHKELHQFLASREQLPLCGRLQLRDLLACVWQRLTKYQLLLEGILQTVSETEGSEESESPEDVARLRRALSVAKDVLNSVNTAIRTTENEHRLRTIQSKLEVRTHGSEWEELRRLDLPQHRLRMEGELNIRSDNNKKISVWALMLEDSLVLLHREGERFVLRPIAQPSTQAPLSPLVKWDKVLFRPNAAMRNTFFLMNINGVQMHELSANTHQEYATWAKFIQESPLAKLTELKPNITPSHQASRSNDDSGINVSRNPSDASEKSTSTVPPEESESERERASLERSSAERERNDKQEAEDKRSAEREERRSAERDTEVTTDREEKQKVRRPTVGRISTHGAAPPALESSEAVIVTEPPAKDHAHTAHTVYTHQERLRRLDEVIARALRDKSAVVSELLGIPAGCYAQVAELATLEALGQVDVNSEIRAAQLDRSASIEGELPADGTDCTDVNQLLLAAQTQANQMTEYLTRALSVDEATSVAARARRAGRCDRCRRHTAGDARAPTEDNTEQPVDRIDEQPLGNDARFADARAASEGTNLAASEAAAGEGRPEDALECTAGAALLASRMVDATSGLQRSLTRLLGALADGDRARRSLPALRDTNDALRARLARDYHTTEEIFFPKESVDQTIQDQPSNGG